MTNFNIIMDVHSTKNYLGLIKDLREIYGLKSRFIEKTLDFEVKENLRFKEEGIKEYVPDTTIMKYITENDEADFIITDKLIGSQGLFKLVAAGGEGREKGGYASSYIFGGNSHLTSKIALHEIGHVRGLAHHLTNLNAGLTLDDEVDCIMIPYPNFAGGISIAEFAELQSKYPCRTCNFILSAKNLKRSVKNLFQYNQSP